MSEAVAANERPEWLPAKFKDGEALAKSYGELESKLGQMSSQLKEQQEQWETFLQEQEAAHQEAASIEDVAFAQDALAHERVAHRGPFGPTAAAIERAYMDGASQVLEQATRRGKVPPPENVEQLRAVLPG